MASLLTVSKNIRHRFSCSALWIVVEELA